MPHARIPAAAIGTLAPAVCVRHRLPARKMRRMVFTSSLPIWAWPLIVLGGRLAHRYLIRTLRKEAFSPAGRAPVVVPPSHGWASPSQ